MTNSVPAMATNVPAMATPTPRKRKRVGSGAAAESVAWIDRYIKNMHENVHVMDGRCIDVLSFVSALKEAVGSDLSINMDGFLRQQYSIKENGMNAIMPARKREVSWMQLKCVPMAIYDNVSNKDDLCRIFPSMMYFCEKVILFAMNINPEIEFSMGTIRPSGPSAIKMAPLWRYMSSIIELAVEILYMDTPAQQPSPLSVPEVHIPKTLEPLLEDFNDI